LSDDPLVQFLLEEAMVALAAADEREAAEEREAERNLEEARERARAEAREELELFKAREASGGVQ
jgi:vacuolar-type H+-ATPase subunit E/Vma4